MSNTMQMVELRDIDYDYDYEPRDGPVERDAAVSMRVWIGGHHEDTVFIVIQNGEEVRQTIKLKKESRLALSAFLGEK